ncbi:protein Brevis radix-like 4 isoform X2 [Wolffia australiana]
MLTCIACTKRTGGSLGQDPEEEEEEEATPRKEARGIAAEETASKGDSKGESAERSGGGRKEDEEEREWVAQVEPGVLITFVALPHGGNDLKRIRFSREMFNRWHAQRWWAENYDKIMELYNVQRFSRHAVPLITPPRPHSQNEESANETKARAEGEVKSNMAAPEGGTKPAAVAPETQTSGDGNSQRSSSGDETSASISIAGDLDREWVEEDNPGVFITIRALPGSRRELRRVRFSREKFSETHARLWWEQNRARVHQQYL